MQALSKKQLKKLHAQSISMAHRSEESEEEPIKQEPKQRPTTSTGEEGQDKGFDIELKWKVVSKVGPGFYNCGNTCFLNSVLQSITYTAPLANYLKEGKHSKNCLLKGQSCTICAYEALVKKYFSAKARAVEPNEILKNLKIIGKKYKIGRQEDAHEFLRDLLDKFHDGCMGHVQSKGFRLEHHSAVSDIFAGKMRSSVLCKTCTHRSDIFEPFLDLPLVIQQNDSLEKCLDGYFKAEILKGDNKYRCEKCKNLTEAAKQFAIVKPPNIFTCVFKRFSADFFRIAKINRFIKYPAELKLNKYVANAGGENLIYDLYAVIVHLGHTCYSGHYYAYVKNSNGSWYKMNDESVSEVKLEKVLQEQAYILFYVKRTPAGSGSKGETKVMNGELKKKPTADEALLANLPNGELKPKLNKNPSTQETPATNGEKSLVNGVTHNKTTEKQEKMNGEMLNGKTKETHQNGLLNHKGAEANGVVSKDLKLSETDKKPNGVKMQIEQPKAVNGEIQKKTPVEKQKPVQINGEKTDVLERNNSADNAAKQPPQKMQKEKDAANGKSATSTTVENTPAFSRSLSWQNSDNLQKTVLRMQKSMSLPESGIDNVADDTLKVLSHPSLERAPSLQRTLSFLRRKSYAIETGLSKLRRLSSLMEPMIIKKIKMEKSPKPSATKQLDSMEFENFERSISMPIEVPKIQKSHSFTQDKGSKSNGLKATSDLRNDLSSWDIDDAVTEFASKDKKKALEKNRKFFEDTENRETEQKNKAKNGMQKAMKVGGNGHQKPMKKFPQ